MVLGKVYEKTNSLRSIAAPLMKELSTKTGESTALFVVDGMKCICMAREMGHSRLVYSINEGDDMELHPTASGRVLLAYADNEFTEKVLSQIPPTQFTANTQTNRKVIEAKLKQIRQRGYDINNEEREEGISALAAPIFDFENKVPAALAVVGPVHRFTGEHRQFMLSALLQASREISRLMGES
jgi:DNA-binding IclR family transcriptional regulator